MKIKIKFLLAISFIMLVSIITYGWHKEEKEISALVLTNIEALAAGENTDLVYCDGVGSIDCDGQKVAFKRRPFKLGF